MLPQRTVHRIVYYSLQNSNISACLQLVIRYRRLNAQSSKKILLSHSMDDNYTTDSLWYFLRLVIFLIIPRSPHTNWANFPVVLILAFLNESVCGRSVRSNGRFPFRFARPFIFGFCVFSWKLRTSPIFLFIDYPSCARDITGINLLPKRFRRMTTSAMISDCSFACFWDVLKWLLRFTHYIENLG